MKITISNLPDNLDDSQQQCLGRDVLLALHQHGIDVNDVVCRFDTGEVGRATYMRATRRTVP